MKSAIGRAGGGPVRHRASEIGGVERIEELGRERMEWV